MRDDGCCLPPESSPTVARLQACGCGSPAARASSSHCLKSSAGSCGAVAGSNSGRLGREVREGAEERAEGFAHGAMLTGRSR